MVSVPWFIHPDLPIAGYCGSYVLIGTLSVLGGTFTLVILVTAAFACDVKQFLHHSDINYGTELKLPFVFANSNWTTQFPPIGICYARLD